MCFPTHLHSISYSVPSIIFLLTMICLFYGLFWCWPFWKTLFLILLFYQFSCSLQMTSFHCRFSWNIIFPFVSLHYVIALLPIFFLSIYITFFQTLLSSSTISYSMSHFSPMILFCSVSTLKPSKDSPNNITYVFIILSVASPQPCIYSETSSSPFWCTLPRLQFYPFYNHATILLSLFFYPV